MLILFSKLKMDFITASIQVIMMPLQLRENQRNVFFTQSVVMQSLGKNSRMKFSMRQKDIQTMTSVILSFCGVMMKTATGFWLQHERKQTVES